MIKIGEGGFAEMWQGEVPDEAKALSYALQMATVRLKGYLAKTMCLAMIDSLPDATLDLLAAETRAVYYDVTMPIETKREIVKASMAGWYMKCGTPAAVEELIQIVFGEGEVVEWFDFTEGEKIPFTFDIETNAQMTEDMVEYFTKIIRRVKNERSHLRRVLINRTAHVKPRFGVGMQTYPNLIITNSRTDIEDSAVHVRGKAGTAPVSYSGITIN